MISYNNINESAIKQLMAIETACHSHPWSEQTMRSCIGGRYFNLAAFKHDTIVGFFIAEQAGPDLTLMDICVLPSEQGQGIATELLARFIAYGEQLEAENLFLEVRESNVRAITLYERVGFTTMSVRKNYYPSTLSDHGFEDAILMGMALGFGFSRT